jgi:Ca2+:H+ antiporter
LAGILADPINAFLAAYENKIDRAIHITINKNIHIALFLTPFTVILGWLVSQDMTLHFQHFETLVFFVNPLMVNSLVRNGKSRYLASAMCIGT